MAGRAPQRSEERRGMTQAFAYSSFLLVKVFFSLTKLTPENL